MNKRKNTPNPGFVRQNLIAVILAAVFVFGGLSNFLVTFPAYSNSLIVIGWMLGVVGCVMMIWRNYSSNLLILGILYLDLIVLCTLIAIRSYSYVYPSSTLLWTIVISASVLVSYTIPVINSPLTRLLRTELTTPKTTVGRWITIAAVLLTPFGGVIAAFVGMLFARQDEKMMPAILIGSLLWIIAVLLPFGTLYPMSPFEGKR